jgi:cytochrome c-type biogenesis protein CcmH/NrfG
MIGAVIFLVFFLLIAPSTRKILTGMLGQSGDWIANWAPFSYIILALLLVAGFFSLYLMAHWPRVQEPENPLARYKNDDAAD